MKKPLFLLGLLLGVIFSKAQNVGIGTTTPLARLHVKDSSVLFSAAGNIPAVPGLPSVQGPGRRMMWYADKAAFRAGYVSATNWDKVKTGNYSTAFGFDNTASGESAIAMGSTNIASGTVSTAMGIYNIASQDAATAMGFSTKASGQYALSAGYLTEATSLCATAIGFATKAFGSSSFATGESTKALGANATAMGVSNTAYSYAETVIGGNSTDYTAAGPSFWEVTDRLFVIGNGPNPGAKNDAFSVLKNGNTCIDPSNKNDGVLTGNALLFGAYNSGEGIASKRNATGNQYGLDFFTAGSIRMSLTVGGNVGIGTNTPLAHLHVKDDAVLFSSTGDVAVTPALPPVEGSGRRMMWYPDKASFRAGYVASANWDRSNTGNYSAAFGFNNTASGKYSFAIGNGTVASGEASLSTGKFTVASGNNAIAMGEQTTASGVFSTSMGYQTSAANAGAFASGFGTNASGQYSTAMGWGTSAGNYAIATGFQSHAFGAASAAFGSNSNAYSSSEMVVGSNNTVYTPTSVNGWNATDRLFVIGNGIDVGQRSDALVVLKNGNMGIGNSTPGFPLNFAGVIGDKISLFGNTGAHYGFGVQSYLLQIHTDAPEADIAFGYGYSNGFGETMRIKGNGNVGIGKMNPSNKLHIVNGASGGTPFAPVFTPLVVEGNTHTYINLLSPDANETAILFGKASDAVSGVIMYNNVDNLNGFQFRTNGNVTRMQLSNNGNLWLQGTLTQNSDIRLKEDIHLLQNSLQNLTQLNGYNYYWKNKNADTSLQTGVMAQELQKLFPELVKENNEGTLSVNYSGLIPVLIEGIKEQQKQINELKLLVQKLIN
jgi:hypothetical protein